jgi:hypothetical protein
MEQRMALSFSDLDGVGALEIGLPISPCSMLDIGQSNIYDADTERLAAWLQRRGGRSPVGWIADYAARSGRDAGGNRTNAAFLSELCAIIGIDYWALDIINGPRVLLCDLNRDGLPENLLEKFEFVLNSGTTEHVLNQYNAFKIIHDATAPGGEMLHILPISGYTDHGYVHYTSRFFFDLAGYNDYEILQAVYVSAGVDSQLFDSVRDYAAIFPMLRQVESSGLMIAIDRYAPEPSIADLGIVLRYRKKRSARFVGALDTATSVAPSPTHILDFYSRHSNRPEAIDSPGPPQAAADCDQGTISAETIATGIEATPLQAELRDAQLGVQALNSRIASLKSEVTTLREEMDMIKRFAWLIRAVRRQTRRWLASLPG